MALSTIFLVNDYIKLLFKSRQYKDVVALQRADDLNFTVLRYNCDLNLLAEQSNNNHNNNNNKDGQYLPGFHDYHLVILSDGQRLGLSIAVYILLILSIFGNSLAFLSTVFKKKIRPLFRTCLISLACSDLITTIFIFTTYIAQFSTPFSSVWKLGEIMCSFVPFAQTTAILVNSLTLVGIALDRYIAVIKIIKGAWEPNGIYCTAWAILIWGLAAGISSPMLSSFYLMEFFIMVTNPNNHSQVIDLTPAEFCLSDKASNSYYYTIVFFLLFLPLLLAFFWLNLTLAKEIWSRRRPIESSSNEDLHKNNSNTNTNTNNNNNNNNNHTPSTISSIVAAAAAAAQADNPQNILNDELMNDEGQQNNNHNNNNNRSTSSSSGAAAAAAAATATATDSKRSTRRRNIKTISKTKTNREIRQLRMFKIIVLLMSVFLLCRLPTWIYLLYKLYHITNTNLHWMLHYCFGLLSICNCILNPLLYTFLTETIQVSFAFINRIKGLNLKVCQCFKRNREDKHEDDTAVARDAIGNDNNNNNKNGDENHLDHKINQKEF